MRQSPSARGGALCDLGAAQTKARLPKAAMLARAMTATAASERCITASYWYRFQVHSGLERRGRDFLQDFCACDRLRRGWRMKMRFCVRRGLGLGVGLLLGSVVTVGQDKPAASAPVRHVQQERLWQTLQKLSEFGKNPEGGVSRVGFTEADLAGRAYVMGLMREAGLAVRVDPAGNIFGRRDGTENLPVLLFGSHIDSVPHGGNFDGDVGSLGAIEVIRALNEQRLKTRHPLEVVVWTNEEGGRFYAGLFGSSAAAGLMPEDVGERRDDAGEKLSDWLKRMGGDALRIKEAKIAPGSVAGYVGLDIKQGAVL